jgi:response regulator RpfG family c-di-GMP phosphodiesterase
MGHMRQHPDIGRHILTDVPHLAQTAEIVQCHEERFDGSGYPRGLVGAAIPLSARLFAVIDTLDAYPIRPPAVEIFLKEELTLRKMR